MKKLLDKKYLPYYLGGALILAVVVAIFLLSDSSQEKIDNELIAELGYDVVSDAAAIYQAFGLDSPWYDPSGWTEDEDAVLSVLVNYDRNTFKDLESAYFKRTKGRHLKADIRDFFTADQAELIGHLL